MRRVAPPLVVALSTITLVTGSCGDGSVIGASATDDTAAAVDQPRDGEGQADALAMAAEVGDIKLSDDEARLVAVEAAWLCRAQRFSFGDPSDMTAARDELLAANSVTAEEYRAFTSELATRLELREAVLAEFATSCLGSD